MSLFPILGDNLTAEASQLPLYAEVMADGHGMPVFRGGAPVIVTGADAVRLWAMTAEAPRMVRDALLINPYITDVSDISVDFAGDTLAISARLKTIYGEVEAYYDE